MAGVMVVPPGVAHMDVDPTLVGGAVGGALEVVVGALEVVVGALVVVDGVLPQGEAVDPVHEPLQVLSTNLEIRPLPPQHLVLSG